MRISKTQKAVQLFEIETTMVLINTLSRLPSWDIHQIFSIVSWTILVEQTARKSN